MELKTSHSCSLLLLVVSGLVFFLPARANSIGINYGQIANNLPSPSKAVPLVKAIGATRVKLYDADPKVLCAFANTGIEFTVGLGNEYLSKMQDQNKALSWVKTNVQAYLPATKITCIAVGNEVLTLNDTSLSDYLLPAMQNVHSALVTLGLDKQITVTTSHSLAILGPSYPPSTGKFRKELVNYVTQVLDFQCKINSPFLINAYPYFAYRANPKHVPLDFVLFQSSQGILDPATNLHYGNMLFAQIDAIHFALADVGYKNLPVQISETGWPSSGDPDEIGATVENAKKYNANLMRIAMKKKGTPMRPESDLNIYVFALFNENLKPGPTSERYYGLFNPDGTPVYSLGIKQSDGGKNTTSAGGGGGGSTPVMGPASGFVAPPGPYLSVTSGTVSLNVKGDSVLGVVWLVGVILIMLS